jgi:integrase
LEFSILFAYSNFFDVDGIPLYWKNRKGTLRMSHHSGIHIYEPLLKHDKFENINEHSFPFSELTNAKISYYLKDWLIDAGINKHITFHCARHTYATLQLTLGTDIYTVSKLLGHKNLSTTEIYAKVINEKKVEAANKIKINF